MLKKMFWPIMAWLAFCAFTATANARVVESFKVRGWRGDAYVNDQTGKFDSCVAIARYRNQISMSVQVDGRYDWWIGFSSPGWNMKAGEKIALRYRIDRGAWQRGTAVAINQQLARMPMPKGGYIITRFRRGRVLTVADGANTYRFKLSGTSRMLARLATCVRKNAGIYGTATAQSNSAGNAGNTPANATSPFGSRPGEAETIIEASQALFNLMGHLDIRGINLKNEKSRARSLKGIHAVAASKNRTLVVHIFGPGRYKSERAVLTSVFAEAAKNCQGDFSSGSGSRQVDDGSMLYFGRSNCVTDNEAINEHYVITQRKRGGIYAYGISDKESGDGGGGGDDKSSQGGGASSGPQPFVTAEQFRRAAQRSAP